MNKPILIGLGGLLGTLCRYWSSQWLDNRLQSQFPYGTAFVNLVGCFAAGLLYQLFEQSSWPPDVRFAVFTGFLGGFTTFSAYALQTVVLAGGGMFSIAAVNVLLSNVAGLLMVWAGSS